MIKNRLLLLEEFWLLTPEKVSWLLVEMRCEEMISVIMFWYIK